MSAIVLSLLPVAGAGLLIALRGRPRAVGPVAVAVLAATVALGLWAALTEPSAAFRWSPAIELRLAVAGFGRVMVVLVPLIATPIVAYAAATETEGRARLLALMVAFVGAMLALVAAADFLTLLIAWELVGALSWALIGHGWRDPENGRSAARAFLTTRLGDLGLYVAAGATFAASGSFAFEAIGGAGSPAREMIAAGVLLAAAAKSAQVPFSPWLFAAMAGPTPVSALLHSATLVASGAYLLIRLEPSLTTVSWFLPAVALVGIVTAISGGIVAALQTHAKRALAASTSAQYGLMFAAVGAGFPAAAGAQLVAHAAFKSLLFLGAGVAIHAKGTAGLGRLRLGRALPRIALLSAVGALALAAVPPLGGAWSKEQVLAGAMDASTWFGAAVLVAGFLSALYAARYQVLVYGRAAEGPGADGPHPLRRPGRIETGSMAALATLTLALSLLWVPGAGRIVEEATGGRLPESAPWETGATVAILAAAFGLAWWLHQRGRLLTLGLGPVAQAAAGNWLGIPVAVSTLVERPVVRLAEWLRVIDDRVIDAGVRRAALVAGGISGLFSRRVEISIDGLVHLVGAVTLSSAAGSRIADDAGVDAAVEATGRGVGLLGHQSRRLQTGQSHQYFVILAGGLAVMAIVLAVYR
jgi:NADH-quinone oxidoreductase subunit L